MFQLVIQVGFLAAIRSWPDGDCGWSVCISQGEWGYSVLFYSYTSPPFPLVSLIPSVIKLPLHIAVPSFYHKASYLLNTPSPFDSQYSIMVSRPCSVVFDTTEQ